MRIIVGSFPIDVFVRRRTGRHGLAGVLLACAVGLALAATPPCAAGDPVWPSITQPPTSNYVPGKWVWAELFTENAAIAVEFYGKVFGWTFQSLHAGHGPDYTLAFSGGDPVGGMLQREHRYDKQKGSRWVGMISVADVKAAAHYAVDHGGKVIVPPRVLAGRGEVALLADPEGAPFGVMRSSSGDPPDFQAEDRQWMWIELWAKDPETMAQFYSGLAGYEIESTERPDGRKDYLLATGAYVRCSIVPSPAPSLPAAWLPYLRVNDVKAAAAQVAQAGGRVVLAPDPKVREGRVALIVDPAGAPMGLAQLPSKDTP
jgi:predicted enzyme related to lactoylglutathione lyase